MKLHRYSHPEGPSFSLIFVVTDLKSLLIFIFVFYKLSLMGQWSMCWKLRASAQAFSCLYCFQGSWLFYPLTHQTLLALLSTLSLPLLQVDYITFVGKRLCYIIDVYFFMGFQVQEGRIWVGYKYSAAFVGEAWQQLSLFQVSSTLAWQVGEPSDIKYVSTQKFQSFNSYPYVMGWGGGLMGRQDYFPVLARTWYMDEATCRRKGNLVTSGSQSC